MQRDERKVSICIWWVGSKRIKKKEVVCVMKGRGFEFARKIVDGIAVEGSKAYEDAKIPEYQTKNSAGADFFQCR